MISTPVERKALIARGAFPKNSHNNYLPTLAQLLTILEKFEECPSEPKDWLSESIRLG
jgi:hypothetical protein